MDRATETTVLLSCILKIFFFRKTATSATRFLYVFHFQCIVYVVRVAVGSSRRKRTGRLACRHHAIWEGVA